MFVRREQTRSNEIMSTNNIELVIHLYRCFLAHLLYLRTLIPVSLNELLEKSKSDILPTATSNASTMRKITRNQLTTLQFTDGIDNIIRCLNKIIDRCKLSNKRFSIYTTFGPSTANPKESYCLHFRECTNIVDVSEMSRVKAKLERNIVRNLIEHPINTIVAPSSKSSWSIFTILCIYKDPISLPLKFISLLDVEDVSMDIIDQSLPSDDSSTFSFRDATTFKLKHKSLFGNNSLRDNEILVAKRPRKLSAVQRRRLLFPVEMGVDLQNVVIKNLLSPDSDKEQSTEKVENWWDGAREWEVAGWWVQRRGVKALKTHPI